MNAEKARQKAQAIVTKRLESLVSNGARGNGRKVPVHEQCRALNQMFAQAWIHG